VTRGGSHRFDRRVGVELFQDVLDIAAHDMT